MRNILRCDAETNFYFLSPSYTLSLRWLIFPTGHTTLKHYTNSLTTNNVIEVIFLHLPKQSEWQPDNSKLWLVQSQIMVISRHRRRKHNSLLKMHAHVYMGCSDWWQNPKWLMSQKDRYSWHLPADALPFNTRCSKDIWKYFCVSLFIVSLG
jgi:hypothetical protein